MKDYKNVAEDVFRRSREIIEQNKLRRKKHIEIGVSAACWAVVGAVGVGVWATSRQNNADTVVSRGQFANDGKDHSQERDTVLSSTTDAETSISYSEKHEPAYSTTANNTDFKCNPPHSNITSHTGIESCSTADVETSYPSTVDVKTSLPEINSDTGDIDIRCCPSHSQICITAHTRIDSFGSEGGDKYAAPEGGQVIFDKSLTDAMAAYGKTDEYGEIMYDVMVEHYKDGKRVNPTRELWESELERFGNSFYFETDSSDPDNVKHYTGIRSASYEMLENFAPSGDYGYVVVLRDNFFGDINTEPNERLYSHGDHTAAFELEGADFCKPRGCISNIDFEIEEVDYSPENGTVIVGESLKKAIEMYGREDKNGELDYRVLIEYYKDGKHIDTTKEVWDNEQERGARLSFETYSSEWGKNVEHRIYRFMTVDELESFEPSGEYGYVLHLYNVYLGNPYSLRDNIINGLYNNGVFIDY